MIASSFIHLSLTKFIFDLWKKTFKTLVHALFSLLLLCGSIHTLAVDVILECIPMNDVQQLEYSASSCSLPVKKVHEISHSYSYIQHQAQRDPQKSSICALFQMQHVLHYGA